MNQLSNIRYGQYTDIDALIDINQQLGPYGWPSEYFYRLFDLETPIWVAENTHGRVCGYLFATFLSEEMRITNITIDQTYRHQGLGQQLLTHVITEAQQAGVWFALLDVRTDNANAIKLYHKLGFMILCQRDAYYANLPINDAYFMQLDLRKFIPSNYQSVAINNSAHQLNELTLLAS